MVVVNSQTDLPEMVAAAHAAGRFTGRLHRWKQKCNKHPDDGNDHQEFHEREPERSLACILHGKDSHIPDAKKWGAGGRSPLSLTLGPRVFARKPNGILKSGQIFGCNVSLEVPASPQNLFTAEHSFAVSPSKPEAIAKDEILTWSQKRSLDFGESQSLLRLVSLAWELFLILRGLIRLAQGSRFSPAISLIR